MTFTSAWGKGVESGRRIGPRGKRDLYLSSSRIPLVVPQADASPPPAKARKLSDPRYYANPFASGPLRGFLVDRGHPPVGQTPGRAAPGLPRGALPRRRRRPGRAGPGGGRFPRKVV